MRWNQTERAGLAGTAIAALLLLGVGGAPMAAADGTISGVSASTTSTTINQPVTLTMTGSGLAPTASNAPIGTCSPVFRITPPSGDVATVTPTFAADGNSAQTTLYPTAVGNFTVFATCATGSPNTGSSVIVAVGKTTASASLSVASQMTVGTTTALTMTLLSSGGVNPLEPTGVVTFSNGTTTLGTANLTPSPTQGRSTATLNWVVPNSVGALTITASYPGDSNFNGSSASAAAVIDLTASAVSLQAASTGQLSGPMPLVARVSPASATGTVSFFVGQGSAQQAIGTPVALASGSASTTWTPAALGAQVITAVYNGDANNRISSSSTTITIAGQAPADAIEVDPNGSLAPLSPTVPFSLEYGLSVQFVTSTSSGAAVKLSVAGPCSLTSGVILKANSGNGTCSLTATSAGGNGYAATSAKYAIDLALRTQTASISAPKSGKVTKGSTLTLAKSGVKTNAGKPVSWKVTSGSSACKISTSSGKVKVKVNGKCTVKGTAAGVSGKYAAYSVTRNYTV
jgi:hypothetical protein